jgi:cell wall-associated NlpC family hydrolase
MHMVTRVDWRRPAAPIMAVVLCALVSACATSGSVPRPRPFPGAALPPEVTPPPAATLPPVDAPPVVIAPPAPPLVVGTALTYRGVPYRNGGSDPSGFDCSGFVQWVFAQHGVKLPREVRTQWSIGSEIERDDVQPGDLVFFETVTPGASHVGIALGNDEFVHAPSSRGVVRVERYTSEYWNKRYLGARRVTGTAVITTTN